ncbi:MAG: hypothetical protein AAFS10_21475, partial [Myxococcota bacterium]
IDAGQDRTLVPIDATGVDVGISTTVTATSALTNSAQLELSTVTAPQAVFGESPNRFDLQPGVPFMFPVELNAPAPESGTTVTLSSSEPSALTFTPETITFGPGEQEEQMVEVVPNALGSFNFIATTDAGVVTQAFATDVVQALLIGTTPESLRSGIDGNQIFFRITTNGIDTLTVLTLEIPSDFVPPTPEEIAILGGDGNAIAEAQVAVGMPLMGPNGGTIVTVSSLSIDPDDAMPWVDLVLTNAEAITWGSTQWYLQVDQGMGLTDVAETPDLFIIGTAADGAGEAQFVTSAVIVGTTTDVVLELFNSAPIAIDQFALVLSGGLNPWILPDLQRPGSIRVEVGGTDVTMAVSAVVQEGDRLELSGLGLMPGQTLTLTLTDVDIPDVRGRYSFITATAGVGGRALGTGESAVLDVLSANQPDIFPTNDPDALAVLEFNNPADIAAGSASDTSGNASNALLYGEPLYRPSQFGRALDLRSTGGLGLFWSPAGGADFQSPFTVEMVLTPRNTSSFTKLLGFDDDSDAGWYYISQAIRSYPNALLLGQGQLIADERHYLAFVSNIEGEVDVYFQGSFLGTMDSGLMGTASELFFMRDDTSTDRNEQFSGTLDALRISSRARTQGELEAIQTQLSTALP